MENDLKARAEAAEKAYEESLQEVLDAMPDTSTLSAEERLQYGMNLLKELRETKRSLKRFTKAKKTRAQRKTSRKQQKKSRKVNR